MPRTHFRNVNIESGATFVEDFKVILSKGVIEALRLTSVLAFSFESLIPSYKIDALFSSLT